MAVQLHKYIGLSTIEAVYVIVAEVGKKVWG